MEKNFYEELSKSIGEKLKTNNFTFKEALNQIEFGEFKKNKEVQSFLKSCIEIRKELLSKGRLSNKEEEFIKNLDTIKSKYFD